jgi:hypothetical protein
MPCRIGAPTRFAAPDNFRNTILFASDEIMTFGWDSAVALVVAAELKGRVVGEKSRDERVRAIHHEDLAILDGRCSDDHAPLCGAGLDGQVRMHKRKVIIHGCGSKGLESGVRVWCF